MYGLNPSENLMTNEKIKRSIVDLDRLPIRFPTHKHEGVFWESLGRAVATFGFLEEILAKAIFAFTATRPYDDSEIKQAYEEWLPKIERVITDPLCNLIDAYGKAVRDHSGATIENLDDLLSDLRKASAIRNILCHGSWRLPNASGASVPFFVNRQKKVVDSAMNHESIDQVQRYAAKLACAVINTVTHMGWQFPGSMIPGRPIWEE